MDVPGLAEMIDWYKTMFWFLAIPAFLLFFYGMAPLGVGRRCSTDA